MTGCFIRRMNHTRQRFWPPALLLERKREKNENHIGESDKIGMERRLKDDGVNMDEEIWKKEKDEGNEAKEDSQKTEFSRLTIWDGKEPELMAASDFRKERIAARHYIWQVCKNSLSYWGVEMRRTGLGHTALLDWSVFSWILNNQLKTPQCPQYRVPQPGTQLWRYEDLSKMAQEREQENG